MTNINRLGYIVLDKVDPFLTVYIKCMKLADVVTSGSTNMSVTRVGEDAPCASYAPITIDIPGSSFLFQLDSVVLNKDGGRYIGAITYKGTLLGTITFVYNKPQTKLVGAQNV